MVIGKSLNSLKIFLGEQISQEKFNFGEFEKLVTENVVTEVTKKFFDKKNYKKKL